MKFKSILAITSILFISSSCNVAVENRPVTTVSASPSSISSTGPVSATSPTIIALRPVSGCTEPLTLTLTGTNLQSGARIKIGESLLTGTGVASNGGITLTIEVTRGDLASISSGVFGVTVINPDSSSAFLNNSFAKACL